MVSNKERLEKLRRQMMHDNLHHEVTPAQNFVSPAVIEYAISCIEQVEDDGK